MEPDHKTDHKKQCIKLGVILGVIVVVVAFFFLIRVLSSDQGNGLKHHENGHRQLQEQPSGRDTVPKAGRFGNRDSMPAKS